MFQRYYHTYEKSQWIGTRARGVRHRGRSVGSRLNKVELTLTFDGNCYTSGSIDVAVWLDQTRQSLERNHKAGRFYRVLHTVFHVVDTPAAISMLSLLELMRTFGTSQELPELLADEILREAYEQHGYWKTELESTFPGIEQWLASWEPPELRFPRLGTVWCISPTHIHPKCNRLIHPNLEELQRIDEALRDLSESVSARLAELTARKLAGKG